MENYEKIHKNVKILNILKVKYRGNMEKLINYDKILYILILKYKEKNR